VHLLMARCQPAQTYIVKVIATDMKTGAAVSTNITLTVW
jgi:hypothetical protein